MLLHGTGKPDAILRAERLKTAIIVHESEAAMQESRKRCVSCSQRLVRRLLPRVFHPACMGQELELPRVTSSHRAYPKSVQIIRRMSIRPWGLLHSCGVDAMEKQARIGEVKCTVLKGTKSRHTDVLRCACAGVVETIVYSRLETIF